MTSDQTPEGRKNRGSRKVDFNVPCRVCGKVTAIYRVRDLTPIGTCCDYAYIGSLGDVMSEAEERHIAMIPTTVLESVFWNEFDVHSLIPRRAYNFKLRYSEEGSRNRRGVFRGWHKENSNVNVIQLRFDLVDREPSKILILPYFAFSDITEVRNDGTLPPLQTTPSAP